MSSKITFLFSGQGSQYYQMGRELYMKLPVFKANVDLLDRVFKSRTGYSLIEVLYDTNMSPADRFDELRYSHPALFVIQYALAKSLIEDGVRPSRLIGLSLGECVSMAVGGVVSPEDMLDTLIKQANLIERECSDGGMIAVLKGVDYFYSHPDVFSGCELAAVNMPQLICISAKQAALDIAEKKLKDGNVVYERLPLRQPFHSAHLEPLRERFISIFSGLKFKESTTEIVSAMSATNNDNYNALHMWRVKRNPILFYQTMQGLIPDRDMTYVDVGPSGSLANFVKYSLPRDAYHSIFSIMSPMGRSVSNYETCINSLNPSMTFKGVAKC